MFGRDEFIEKAVKGKGNSLLQDEKQRYDCTRGQHLNPFCSDNCENIRNLL